MDWSNFNCFSTKIEFSRQSLQNTNTEFYIKSFSAFGEAWTGGSKDTTTLPVLEKQYVPTRNA